MKRRILFIILLVFNVVFCFCQEIPGDVSPESSEIIQQISFEGFSSILGFQNMNIGLKNNSLMIQSGNQNKLTLKQTGHTPEKDNQTFNFQIGNNNELSLEQNGNGNLLLSFQMGYLIDENFHHTCDILGLDPLFQYNVIQNSEISVSQNNLKEAIDDGNKIVISQQGYDNGLLAIQQGVNNSLSAAQNGKNNYLLVLQKGHDNSVTEYRQDNYSMGHVFDSINQNGDNLSITTDGFPRSHPTENFYRQTGTNLSIELHNEFIEPVSGIAITQTGRDMKIIVNQSYFPVP